MEHKVTEVTKMCREREPIQKEELKTEDAVCGCGCLGFKERESKVPDKRAMRDNLLP